eukprot:2672663-Prymnesium_polylepis.1
MVSHAALTTAERGKRMEQTSAAVSASMPCHRPSLPASYSVRITSCGAARKTRRAARDVRSDAAPRERRGEVRRMRGEAR